MVKEQKKAIKNRVKISFLLIILIFIAYDPVMKNIKPLRSNVKDNEWKKIELIPIIESSVDRNEHKYRWQWDTVFTNSVSHVGKLISDYDYFTNTELDYYVQYLNGNPTYIAFGNRYNVYTKKIKFRWYEIKDSKNNVLKYSEDERKYADIYNKVQNKEMILIPK